MFVIKISDINNVRKIKLFNLNPKLSVEEGLVFSVNSQLTIFSERTIAYAMVISLWLFFVTDFRGE